MTIRSAKTGNDCAAPSKNARHCVVKEAEAKIIGGNKRKNEQERSYHHGSQRTRKKSQNTGKEHMPRMLDKERSASRECKNEQMLGDTLIMDNLPMDLAIPPLCSSKIPDTITYCPESPGIQINAQTSHEFGLKNEGAQVNNTSTSARPLDKSWLTNGRFEFERPDSPENKRPLPSANDHRRQSFNLKPESVTAEDSTQIAEKLQPSQIRSSWYNRPEPHTRYDTYARDSDIHVGHSKNKESKRNYKAKSCFSRRKPGSSMETLDMTTVPDTLPLFNDLTRENKKKEQQAESMIEIISDSDDEDLPPGRQRGKSENKTSCQLEDRKTDNLKVWEEECREYYRHHKGCPPSVRFAELELYVNECRKENGLGSLEYSCPGAFCPDLSSIEPSTKGLQLGRP